MTNRQKVILAGMGVALAFLFCLAVAWYSSGNLDAVTDIHQEAHEAAADVKAIVEDAKRKEIANREEIQNDVGYLGGDSIADAIGELIRKHQSEQRQ